METIQQKCPQCQATLELPTSAIGRKARCPACQHTFTVPEAGPSPGAEPVSAAGRPVSPADVADPFAPRAPGGPDVGAAPTEPTRTAAYNPYAMTPGMATAAAAPAPRKGELVIQQVNIDKIVSTTTAVFMARWQPLILGGLIVFGISFAVGLVVGFGNVFLIAQGPQFTVLLNSVLQVLIGLMSYYFYLGLIRIGLAVSRGEEASPGAVFVPLGMFARALIPITILVLIGASSQFAMFAIDPNVNPGAFGAGPWAGLVPVIAALGVGMIAALILLVTWPFLYLVADDRASNFRAVALGFQIATTNLINSFLLALIAMVLSIGYVCTCGFAAIVTQPVLILLGTVGYLMMTGQEVRDPSDTPAPVPNYSYTPAKF